MSDLGTELEPQLQEHEAGVADLIAAYEAAEVPYFEAVTAATPGVQQFIAASSSVWVPSADMG